MTDAMVYATLVAAMAAVAAITNTVVGSFAIDLYRAIGRQDWADAALRDGKRLTLACAIIAILAYAVAVVSPMF